MSKQLVEKYAEGGLDEPYLQVLLRYLNEKNKKASVRTVGVLTSIGINQATREYNS
jgi:hypothetical protein